MNNPANDGSKNEVRNPPFAAENDIWNAYHHLILSPDQHRIRKLIARYRLFEMALNVPGVIVECGVYKGIGLVFWAKLLEIFAAGLHKRVLGFDVFGPFKEVQLLEMEENVASRHDHRTGGGVSKAEIDAIVKTAGLTHRVELIEGDITQTASDYLAQNFGLRISLLHLDLDTYEGTKAALEAFWPSVSRGGVVVFDEYGVAGMGESRAVDEFFADSEVQPIAVPYATTPSAYLTKP